MMAVLRLHQTTSFIFSMRQEENLGYKYLKKELEEVMELLTLQTVMDAGNGGRVEALACQQ